MAQRDPVLVANTREWLRRAEEDVGTAAFLLTAPSPFVRSARCSTVSRPSKRR